MTRIVTLVLGVAIALAVPAILAVTGLRLATNDRYVEAVYDRGGIPDDRYGLSEEARTALALVGLRSILPSSDEGIDLLRVARLPDGSAAFGDRELDHMADVRALVADAYRFQVVALIAIGGLALLLGLGRSTRTVVPVALARGAILTIALAVVVAVGAATSYDRFESVFHGLFFEGDTWRFEETDTLRRLYPDRFWFDTAVALGLVAVLQAAVLYPLARMWARRAGTRRGFRMAARTESS
jgi:integral membrane protein (TIGR01906 family)